VITASSASGICSGHYKALIVHCDAAIQPGGVRVRANEQEEMAQGTGVSVARLTIAEHRRGEARALVSLQRNHFGSGMQLNIGERGNAYSTGPLEDRRLSGANA